jgi:SAM-dependent methyltransferase
MEPLRLVSCDRALARWNSDAASTGPAVGSLASRSMSSPNRLDFYDVELRAHHEHLRAAYGIGRGDEVLDIGCGTGLTTREAGRATAPGRVLGVDVSERMLERARELTARERLESVNYELGDAQMCRFDPERFDVAISRFGTMFFSDPAAAFANIASALRPQGRLVWLVWQRREMNEWALAIDGALGSAAKLPPPTADPFSLGDAEATREMLELAGFDAVRLEGVHEPVLYGHDIDTALGFVCGFQDVSAALGAMSHEAAAQAMDQLRETIEAHYAGDQGVAFDSRSWLITAVRP